MNELSPNTGIAAGKAMPHVPNMDEMMFFDGKPRALGLYLAFTAKLFALCPEAGMRVQKTQITFTNPKVFACVSTAKLRPAAQRPKEYIVVTLGLGERLSSPRIDAAVEPYPNRWTHHILISSPEEIDDELMGWVRTAHEFSRRK